MYFDRQTQLFTCWEPTNTVVIFLAGVHFVIFAGVRVTFSPDSTDMAKEQCFILCRCGKHEGNLEKTRGNL